MEDPAERLIRRAVNRQSPPHLGPTFAEDVLRKVAAHERRAVPSRAGEGRRWLAAAMWLLAGVASVAVLAHLEWSSGSRAVASGLGLAIVPVAYSASIWARPLRALLALCGGQMVADAEGEPRSRRIRERG